METANVILLFVNSLHWFYFWWCWWPLKI